MFLSCDFDKVNILLFIRTVIINFNYIVLTYSFSYIISSLLLIYFLDKYRNPVNSFLFKIFYLIIFLNISGLPFFIGFFGKLPLILFFLKKSNWLLLSLFIFFNILFLNMYISMLNTLFFKKNKYSFKKNVYKKTLFVLLILNIFWVFLVDKFYTILVSFLF